MTWQLGAPTLRLVLLVAVPLLAACTDRVNEPEPPAPAAVTVVIAPPPAAELREAFDRAQQLRVHLAREGLPDLVRVMDRPSAGEARMSLTVDMTRDREPARLTVELLYDAAARFRGSGELVLRAGETATLPLAVEPLPARVQVQKPLPPITSVGDTLQLRGAAVFADGAEVPGLVLTWSALEPGVVEVGSDGRLVSVAEGEARIEARHQELADTVRVQVKAVVASVEVEPDTASVELGATVQLRVRLRDARGNPLATSDAGGDAIVGREVSWISSRPMIAQVDAWTGVVSGLAPDTVTVTAATAEGKSGSARVTVIALPPLVSDCSAREISATEAALACTVAPRRTLTTVRVEWGSSDSLANRTAPSALSSDSITQEVRQTLTGLSPRTTYFWRLEAVNLGGTARSEILSFTTPDVPPSAPAELTAAASGLRVELSWKDRSDNEEGFRIERRTGTSSQWSEVGSVAAGVTSYAEGELSAGTTYRYRVRAWNGVGTSDYSNAVEVTAYSAPLVTTAPASGVTAGGATLHGSVTPNGASTEAWFEWGTSSTLSSPDSTARQSVGGGSEPATITASLTGLLPGVSYFYRIAARNDGGFSRGTIQTFTTKQAAPAAPGALTAAAAGAGAIELAWQDLSHNEEGFRIERRVLDGAFGEIITLAADVTRYRDDEVQAGTTYEYRVRAFNASGNSGYSNAAQATVPGEDRPTPPLQTLVDDFAGREIDVAKWMHYDEPSRTRQDDRLVVTLTPGVAGYGGLMYRLPHRLTGSAFFAEISQVAAGGPNTETFVGIATLDEQEYVLITSFSGRISAWRKWRGQPYFRVGAEIAYHPVNHRFRRIREQGGIVYFEVSANGTTWVQPASGWSVAHSFSDPGSVHGLVGAGAFTPDPNAGTAIIENVNTAVPAIPRGLAATVSAAAIILTWEDRSVNEQGFRVERRVAGGTFAEIASVAIDGTQYRDDSTEAGATYEYRVRAFNGSGNSSYSNSVQASRQP